MKRYAKNPSELVIQNPTDSNMAKRKRDSQGRFKRKNPSITEEFTDTGKDLFMQYGLAALAATGAVKGAQYVVNQIPGIPAWTKEWGAIVGPGVGGIILTMMTDKKSAIMQGLSGGMVLATANGLSDKFINGGGTDNEMSDAVLEKGDMIVKEDGYLYDQDGNRIAQISGDSIESTSQPQQQQALPAASSFDVEDNNALGDSFVDSWEQGEAWEA